LIEVGVHIEREVLDLTDAGTKIVPPFIHAACYITHFHELGLAWSQKQGPGQFAFVDGKVRNLFPAHKKPDIVVNSLFRGELEFKSGALGRIRGISDFISASELHAVC